MSTAYTAVLTGDLLLGPQDAHLIDLLLALGEPEPAPVSDAA